MHDDLRDAFRRVDPPAGFADRVIRNVQNVRLKPDATKVRASRPASPLARWAIAATLVAAVGGGAWYRVEERRRAEGEEAKRQVLLSLNIAGTKLRSIEIKVNSHEEGR